MLFKKSHNVKPSPPPVPDDSRQEIATHLRLADKHIKEGNLSDAKVELDAVRAVDPKNVYALALEERRQALEDAAKKAAQAETQPISPAVQEEKPQIDEKAIRAEIEQRLGSEYDNRFTDEIRKAEQRIAEALKKEREWQEAERASLIASLEKEKEGFKRELEKQSREKFELEVGKMEAAFRQQLASERKKAEEETRAEMSALYEKSMLELKEAAIKEKRSLLEKERKAIADSKKQMQAEFERLLDAEMGKVKASTIAEQEKEREKLVDAARDRLQKEFEEKLAAERQRIEEQITSQQRDSEASYANRQRKLESETRNALERRLDEIQINERKELDRRSSELRAQLEAEYAAKLVGELAAEREKAEEQVEEELKERLTKLEQERKKVVQEEQSKLDEVHNAMKVELETELEKRIAAAKNSAEIAYEEKLKLLGFRLPDTREEKLRAYMARLSEAWASPPVTHEAARDLMQLRDMLGLSFEDHIQCEGEIRLQVYVTEVEREMRRGGVKSIDDTGLAELKRKYQITSEESLKVEPYISSVCQHADMKGAILLVDDEPEFLDTVKAVLEGYGYSVLTRRSTSDALKLLETTNVEMIISDVVFPEPEEDGFLFYEQVQQMPNMKKVPFILLSGMHEGFFVRTGIQLGVDDYLTKPVELDMLAAVVEGKLKKYRLLRESS